MSNILTEHQDGVCVLRLARPEKKNAITTAMYADLRVALDAARDDAEVRCVVLAGGPGVFTAGNDVMDFLQQPPTSEQSPVFQFLAALVAFPKPVVAAVDGAAVGIGTTMLLHCDVVVATGRARFALPFAKLALVPEAASSLLLPLAVGYHRAAEWLLLGEPFGGDEAWRAGLVNRIAEPEALESTALSIASAIAALPPEAVLASKRLLKDPLREQTMDAIRREAAVFVERLKSREAKRAFAAFLSKA
jgi:enoyl-CoA hydratase/carnithine racemase